MKATARTCLRFIAAGVLLLSAGSIATAVEFEVVSAMDLDPAIDYGEPKLTFSQDLKPVWLMALARPEADLQWQAADTISRAHLIGIPGLEVTIDPLLARLQESDGHPLVRLAAARALVVLDAKTAAPALFDFATTEGIEAAQVIEPALARWNHQPMHAVWMKRLAEPRPSRRRLILAIRSLAEVNATKAAAPLLKLAQSTTRSSDIRLEAAQATAKLQTSGLETVAAELAGDKSVSGILGRLIGASLLAQHSGMQAQTLLLTLAEDAEPAVATIALQRLLEIDPNLIIEMADQIIASRDANVRRLCAEALIAKPTQATIKQLGPMLDDAHPTVRRYVRKSLVQLAENEAFDGTVREVAFDMLATDRWRGLEQAVVLLTALDDKQAADRFVDLLEFERPEVLVAAAGGLRKLAVPETLPAMLDRAMRVTESKYAINKSSAGLVEQTAQLFQAFGEMKFTESHTLLRRYIPKNSFPLETRSAAIWSLGWIYADDSQPDISKQLVGRLQDTDGDMPEEDRIRRFAAVSLGRMKSQDALAVLREHYKVETANSYVGYASGWAVHEITGDPLPEPEMTTRTPIGWFLEPLR